MAPLSTFLSAALLLPLLAIAAPAPAASPAPRRGDRFLGVPIANPDANDIIPNKFIVVYNSTFSSDEIDAHQAKVMTTVAKRNIGKRSPIDNRFLSTSVNAIKINTWRAMSLEADDKDMIDMFSTSDVISYIEADAKVSLSAAQTQQGAPSGLIRLSNAAAGGTTYTFDSTAGQGITAFIVDTGILTTHSEFEGRATMAANFVNNVDTDENGHGSHVAGTIGGATFGVAKNVNLMGVKVLDADGAGSNSGVIAGMQFGRQISSFFI